MKRLRTSFGTGELSPDVPVDRDNEEEMTAYASYLVARGDYGDAEQVLSADIPHIRLRVFKEPAILHDGDDSGIHERRQLSHRAHKTISRCRELACARQRRQLSARLHTLQLIQAHSSPLAILVTSDDPKDDSLVKNPF